MRDHIIREVQRLAAANAGQAPGENAFARETGIASHQWRGKFWARWSDALADAGFEPNKWNSKHNSDLVLETIAVLCRHFGRLPTVPELELQRRTDASIPSAQTVRRHFGSRTNLIAALANLAANSHEFSDIAALLPAQSISRVEATPPRRNEEGFVYLIQAGDFHKIGRSDDIERRVKEIRIALPDKATLIHSIRTDDPAGIEAYWHQRFKNRRANGEWFRLSSLDVSAFKKRKYQ